MRRTAFVIGTLAAAVLVAACGGDTGARFPEDDRVVTAARYVEEPHVFREELLADAWVRQIRVGSSTFGREIPRIVRIEIDGIGPLRERDVALQTQPSVTLFSGPREQRMKQLLEGMLGVLDERGGLVAGIAITTSPASFEAAAIAPFVEDQLVGGDISASDRAFLTEYLSFIARERARHTLAWFYPRSTWMTIGADIGGIIRRHASTPGKVKPDDGIYAAYVLRHEIEHAVTAADFDQNERFDWIEEGGADMLASWPGAAAETAKAMGLPYPKRFETRRFETKRAGYPDWRRAMYLLVQAAGVDVTSAHEFGAASDLLQEQEPRHVPRRLAEAIADEQGLTPQRRARLVRQITELDGDLAATRRLVGAWL